MVLTESARKSIQGCPMAINLRTGRRLVGAEDVTCAVTGLGNRFTIFGILPLISTPRFLRFRKTTSAVSWPHCLRGSLSPHPAIAPLRDLPSMIFLMGRGDRLP